MISHFVVSATCSFWKSCESLEHAIDNCSYSLKGGNCQDEFQKNSLVIFIARHGLSIFTFLLHLWINERRATPFEKKIQKFLHEFFNPNSSLAIGKSKGRDPTKFLTYFSASLFVGLLSSGCCNWPTSPASPHHKRWLVFWPIFVQKLEKYRAVRFVSLCWHQNCRLEYCKKRFLKTPPRL